MARHRFTPEERARAKAAITPEARSRGALRAWAKKSPEERRAMTTAAHAASRGRSVAAENHLVKEALALIAMAAEAER